MRGRKGYMCSMTLSRRIRTIYMQKSQESIPTQCAKNFLVMAFAETIHKVSEYGYFVRRLGHFGMSWVSFQQ